MDFRDVTMDELLSAVYDVVRADEVPPEPGKCGPAVPAEAAPVPAIPTQATSIPPVAQPPILPSAVSTPATPSPLPLATPNPPRVVAAPDPIPTPVPTPVPTLPSPPPTIPKPDPLPPPSPPRPEPVKPVERPREPAPYASTHAVPLRTTDDAGYASQLAQLRAQGVTHDTEVLRMLLDQYKGNVSSVFRHIETTRQEHEAAKRLEAAVTVLIAEGFKHSRSELRYFVEAYGGDVGAVRAHLKAHEQAASTPPKKDYSAQVASLEAKGYQLDTERLQGLLEAFEGNVAEVEKVLGEIAVRRETARRPDAAAPGVCTCLGARSGYHRQGCPGAPQS